MSDTAFDVLPTLLTFTPRLLSSLVLTGLWAWVSSPFIIAGLFILSWLSSKLGTAAPVKQADGVVQDGREQRGRSGRPTPESFAREARSGSNSSSSMRSFSDSETASSSDSLRSEHRFAFPGLGHQSRHLQTMLGGPGSRRANWVNWIINVCLFAAVMQRMAPWQAFSAQAMSPFSVTVSTGVTQVTLDVQLAEAMWPASVATEDAYCVQLLPIDARDTLRQTRLDLAHVRSSEPQTIFYEGLRPGTAYRMQVIQRDVKGKTHRHLQRVVRTDLPTDLYLPDKRCSLGLHASGIGHSVRERIHRLFAQSLCGPIGGRSLLHQVDLLKAAFRSRLSFA